MQQRDKPIDLAVESVFLGFIWGLYLELECESPTEVLVFSETRTLRGSSLRRGRDRVLMPCCRRFEMGKVELGRCKGDWSSRWDWQKMIGGLCRKCCHFEGIRRGVDGMK